MRRFVIFCFFAVCCSQETVSERTSIDTESSNDTSQDSGSTNVFEGTQIPDSFPDVGALPECTASLACSNVIVTAAHCVKNNSIPFKAGTTKQPISANVIYMEGREGSASSDIAIGVLDKDIEKNSFRIKLPTLKDKKDRLEKGDSLTIIGFGKWAANSLGMSSVRRSGTVTFDRYDQDRDAITIVPGTKSQMTCPGDSGGPIRKGGVTYGIAASGDSHICGDAGEVLYSPLDGSKEDGTDLRQGQMNQTWLINKLDDYCGANHFVKLAVEIGPIGPIGGAASDSSVKSQFGREAGEASYDASDRDVLCDPLKTKCRTMYPVKANSKISLIAIPSDGALQEKFVRWENVTPGSCPCDNQTGLTCNIPINNSKPEIQENSCRAIFRYGESTVFAKILYSLATKADVVALQKTGKVSIYAGEEKIISDCTSAFTDPICKSSVPVDPVIQRLKYVAEDSPPEIIFSNWLHADGGDCGCVKQSEKICEFNGIRRPDCRAHFRVILPKPTSTSMPVPSATATATPINTMTATSTATKTATATSTKASTNTPASTPSSTGTATATSTSTRTITATATFAVTATQTFTPTHTATKTNTATHTPTQTATATQTSTAAPTPTMTKTSTAVSVVKYPVTSRLYSTLQSGSSTDITTEYTIERSVSGTACSGAYSSDVRICQGFAAGTQVTLKAPDIPGKVFTGWFLNQQPSSSSKSLILSVNAATDTYAVYKPAVYVLQLIPDGNLSGLETFTVNQESATCTPASSTCFGLLTSPVIVTATAPAGEIFVGWTGPASTCGASASCSISSSDVANKLVPRPYFVRTTSEIRTASKGSGTVSFVTGGNCAIPVSNCTVNTTDCKVFAYNARVCVSANAQGGWSFKEFASGFPPGVAKTGATTGEINVFSTDTITGIFEQQATPTSTPTKTPTRTPTTISGAKRYLTVEVANSGNAHGRVQASDASIDCSATQCQAVYPITTSIQLIASPIEDFVSWGGCAVNPIERNKCTVSPGPAAAVVTATFQK